MAAVVVGLVLAGLLASHLLPGVGLRWGLSEIFRRLGMAEVSMTDADLSLFNGRVVIHRMVAKPPAGAALGLLGLDIDFQWRPLLDRRVAVDRIGLQGLAIEVKRSGRGWEINGLPVAIGGSGAPGDKPWTFEMDSLTLSDSRLSLIDGAARFEIDVAELTMENLRSGTPEAPLRFHLKGRANGAAVLLSGTATPFSSTPTFEIDLHADGLALAALAIAGLHGQLTGDVKLAGRVEASGLSLSAAGAVSAKGLTVRLGDDVAELGRAGLTAHRMEWQGARQRLSFAGTLDATAVAAKTAAGSLNAATVKVEAGRLDWEAGRLAFTGSLDATTLAAAAAAGSLNAEALKVEAGELDWQQDRLAFSGRAEIDQAQVEFGDFTASQRHATADIQLQSHGGDWPAATIKLVSEGLLVRETDGGRDWLSLDRLESGDIQLVATGRLAAAKLTARGVAALRQEARGADKGFHWRAEARELRAARVAYDLESGGITLGELTLAAPTLRLARVAEGILGMPAAKGDGSASPPLAIGRLTATAGRLVFEDRTLDEPLRLEFKPVDLTLSNLDSGQPDRDVGFTLGARTGEASLAASGSMRPFAREMSARLRAEAKAFELPPLSPYAAEILGVDLNTGHFDGKVELEIRHHALDGKVELVLSNLFVEPPPPDAPIARKIDLPIETVLNLLRDGEDRIRLTVPVGGNLADPQFDVSDAVSQAVAGALKSTAATTLKVVFPVAALISMVIDADEKARLALPPLEFAPGTSELAGEHRTRLMAIAEMMRGRPGLKLKLCGKAVPSDWPALVAARSREETPLLSRLQRLMGMEKTSLPIDRAVLGELAAGRAGAAKEFLADGSGIDPGRLFECRPEVDDDDKTARVDLLL